MANFIKSVIVALTGVMLGLAATWLSIEKGHGFGAVRAGPWIGWPRAGSPSADPYARAAISRTGEVPLSLAEGLSFQAHEDSAGQPLQRNCVYTIEPPIPVARYWSLSVSTPDGAALSNDFDRSGITSSEIIRSGSGTFKIVMAQGVQPGNWLPLDSTGPFVLVLRLYDTPVSAATSALRASDMPAIKRGACA